MLALLVLALYLAASLPSPARAAHRSPHVILVLARGLTSDTLLDDLQQPVWQPLRDRCGVALLNCAVRSSGEPHALALGTLLRGVRSGEDAARALELGDRVRRAGKQVLVMNTGSELLDADETRSIYPYLGDLADLVIIQSDAPAAPDSALHTALRLLATKQPQDLLIFTTPDPGPFRGGNWSHLGLALVAGPGWGGDWASSASTRTRGLVTNLDVVPTVLQHLGIPPHDLPGHPFRTAGQGTVDTLYRKTLSLRATHESMRPGLIGWGAFAFLGFVLGVASLLIPGWDRLRPTSRFSLTWAASFIPAMLLAGLVFYSSARELVGRVAVMSLMLAVATWSARRRISPVLSIYALIVLTVLVDLFTGSHLLQRSLLGDYAFTGARFYGIGNEFEGLILGTSILAPIWWIQGRKGSGFRVPGEPDGTETGAGHDPTPNPSPGRRGEVDRSIPGASEVDYVPANSPRYRGDGGATASPILPYSHTPTLLVIAALWLITLYAVAAPTRGADFGGAFSLAVGYVAAAAGLWQLRTGKRLSLRQLLLAGVVVALVVAAMIGADLLRPAGSRSHVGDLAARALSEGWGPVWEIAVRKVAMNVSFILSPYCLVSLAGVLPVVLFGYHKLDPTSRGILARRPLLRVGLVAALVGAVAGLLANDSGIVAWAFATGCALLLCLDLMLDDGARKAPGGEIA